MDRYQWISPGYHPVSPACVSNNGDATAHKVPQKITTPVAEARMAVGKDSSQKIIATEYSKVPDLKAKNDWEKNWKNLRIFWNDVKRCGKEVQNPEVP